MKITKSIFVESSEDDEYYWRNRPSHHVSNPDVKKFSIEKEIQEIEYVLNNHNLDSYTREDYEIKLKKLKGKL